MTERSEEPRVNVNDVTGPYQGKVWADVTADATVISQDLSAVDPDGGGDQNWTGSWVEITALTADIGFFFRASGSATDPDLSETHDSGGSPAESCKTLAAGTTIMRWVDPDFPVFVLIGTGAGRVEICKADRT